MAKKKVIIDNGIAGFGVNQVEIDYVLKYNESFKDNPFDIGGKIEGSIWVETATQAEKDNYAKEQSFIQMQSFINNNEANGLEYYNQKKVEITIQLFGRSQVEVNPVVIEIDNLVTPILNQLKSGDYYSAVTLQLAQPTIQEVIDLRIDILAYAANYVATHYA